MREQDATTQTSEALSNRRSGRHAMSFTDAAEAVLRSSGEPMHYAAIAQLAIEQGLVSTEGRTPATSMNVMINTDIRARQSRDEPPRFVRVGTGLYGLAEPMPQDLGTEIEEHNNEVRKGLKASLLDMAPDAFEELIAELLTEMGFEDVEVTSASSDGGIDVRGALIVDQVVRIRMAVQAKRWRQNVQKPIVQQLRGSLGAHEQGLIITTSDFSKGAREEAERADAAPVAVVNGEQLVRLLIRHGIGVSRTPYELLTLEELPGAEA